MLARVGDDSLAAHQIAVQLFVFLALVLDAIAIAGQVIVGRSLGAGDAEAAYSAALRMIEWAVAAGALLVRAGGAAVARARLGDRGRVGGARGPDRRAARDLRVALL